MKEFKLYLDNSNMGDPILRQKQDDVRVIIGGENALDTFHEVLESIGVNGGEHPGLYEKDDKDYLAVMADVMSEADGEVIVNGDTMNWCLGVDYEGY